MRLFPGIHVPKAKAAARALRRLLRRLTVRGVTLGVEVACLAVTLVILLSGGRAAFFDDVSSRADVVVAAATLAVFVAIHAALRKRIVPALERRFSPAPYDEHTVLLDLGMEARSADSVDALYASIVGRVGNALEAERISIFVHDDATGDYPCRKATAGGEDDDSLALAGTSFVVRRLGKLAAPLDLTPADLEAWSRAFGDAPREVRDARESECRVLKLVGASLLVQIRTRSQLIGILAVGRRRAGHKFSAADREMLMLVAGQLAFVIENSKMLERIMAEERLRRELALAAEVQQRLLPSRPPVSSYLELSGYCQPARGVGGDYYDFIELGGQRLGVAVADVAGKGMSAALLMSSVQASLRSQTIAHAGAGPGASVAGLVSTLNRLVCRSTGAATYVTFFYAEFDEKRRELTYVNAGHNPPLLMRAGGSGRYDELTTGGPVIGIFDTGDYEQDTLGFESDDVLFIYTDGVTEALDESEEEFGEQRLREALLASADLSADGVRDAIVRAIQEWCGRASQHDDLTFVVVKLK